MNDDISPQIRMDTSTGVVTLEIETAYGPITLSYSPEAIEAGIAALAADILKRAKEGGSQAEAVERLGLPTEVVTGAAAVYEERANQVFPLDAIEQFSPSSRAYSRGTVEQLSDNLVPALILMLDYLAATALVVGSADSDPQWRQKVASEHRATLEILQERLSEGIQRLYARQNSDNLGSAQ